MRSTGVLALALGVALLGPSILTPGWAARKYYPPGFKPPTDQTLIPSSVNPAETPTKVPVVVPQVQGGKQIIIKTVPVTVEKTVTVQPKPRDPLVVLMEEHRHFDALRLVDERLKKSPNNLTLQLFRGKILRDQGNYGKALEQYTVILEKNRSKNARADAQNGIGWTYYQKSMHERQMGNYGVADASLRSADMAFRQAAHLAPNMAYAWAGLGKVALANGHAKDAEVWIKKAKKLGPNDLSVQLADAELLLAQKKPEEALQVLYGTKKMSTRDPEVYMLLARASLVTGKVDDAIINLKQLLELEPDHTEALKLLSQSYERKMKPEDAEVALEKAISLNPMDENSVNALLKIYEQRREDDRSILVLKTLLKDHPGQAAYGLALLQRLANMGRWNEVYEEGSGIIDDTISVDAEAASDAGLIQQDPAIAQQVLAQKEGIVSLFARSVYQHGREMLDRKPLLKQPIVQKAQAFAQMNLDRESKIFGPFSGQSLQERLSLLLIDPMHVSAPLPVDLRPAPQDLPAAIQISFLQGDHARHDQWVFQGKDLQNSLGLAKLLYDLGDYQGATFLVDNYLAQHPSDSEAKQFKGKILADQAALQENIEILGMLPRRIPDWYWQKTACEVLKLGAANGNAHAVLAKALEKRHHPELALIQMQLAAKYATTPKDSEYWTRRADKANRNLSRK